jgi:hypothetical protein
MARATTHMNKLFVHKLPPQWRQQSVLFVPKSEWQTYSLAVPELRVCAIPDKVKGIIRTRRWIAEYAKKNDHEKFVMCDDDLRFHVRMGRDDWHLREASNKELGLMFDWIEKKLNKHAQVGISAREGNNRAGTGDVNELTAMNTRLLRVYAYRTELFLDACKAAKVPETFTMDDFHVTLTLLRSGHSNCQTYWWANDQRGTQDVGGASTYRTLETHDASAKLLAEMHPEYVRLHQKVNKSAQNGLGTRLEVVISWKRAYEEGKN